MGEDITAEANGEEEHQELIEPTETAQPYEHGEYSYPSIQFDVPPYRTYHFSHQLRTSPNPNNFFKAIKWSPDGSCFLTSSEDNNLRIFALPDYGSSEYLNASSSHDDQDSYAASLVVGEGESIYDSCWYPYMSASDPVSCVFATTTRDHPIHLWDATSGQLRCTYRAYDAVDEITAAFSIAFNPAATKIFGGYNKTIRVFDIHRPGRDFRQYPTLQKNKEGQTGIISAIAFSPSHTGMLATGSYSNSTAIYREDNMELLYVLHGQEGGITHVQFSKDGNYLYTGGRKEEVIYMIGDLFHHLHAVDDVLHPFFLKDPYIMCWDIRNTVEAVYKLYRSSGDTNQRISFDIDPSGRYLGTGGQDGLIHFYDLQTGQWTSSFQAASDTVNGFSFHPYLPMAASSSGHRRFEGPDDETSEDFQLSGYENCASVWSFSVADNVNDIELNGETGREETL